MKKTAIIAAMLLLGADRLAAQTAADPNAIDFSGKMDTIIAKSFVQNLNSGLLNADPYQDFFIGIGRGTSLVRYGGPFILSDPGFYDPIGVPVILADLTVSGTKGIVTNEPQLYKGLGAFPYFDSVGSTIFVVNNQFSSEGIIGSADVNRDGTPDLICAGGTQQWAGIEIYYGSPHISDSLFKYPDDSIRYDPSSRSWHGAVVGTFSKEGNPMIFLTLGARTTDSAHKEIFRIGVLRHLDDLAHDTIVYLSQTSNDDYFNPGDSMIAVKGIYSMDITGDGIPDLLVSDDVHIWIFKGSDSLGYYPLTKSRAYYSIPNPKLLDPSLPNADDIVHFGEYMHSCGDLTGSGIPYLMVSAGPDVTQDIFQAWAFFYAGGKALDTLYDAMVNIENEEQGFDMDTLHSIDNSGRSAVLLHDPIDYWASGEDFDFLLYKNANNIPHRTNPQMLVQSTIPILSDSLGVIMGSNYVKLNAVMSKSEESRIAVFNILGRQIYSNEGSLDPGDNITYIDTRSWPSGTYIAAVTGERGSIASKFIIQH